MLHAFGSQGLHEVIIELHPGATCHPLEVAHLVKRHGGGPGDKVRPGLEGGKPPPHHHAGALEHILRIMPVGHQRHHVPEKESVRTIEQPHKFLLPLRKERGRQVGGG